MIAQFCPRRGRHRCRRRGTSPTLPALVLLLASSALLLVLLPSPGPLRLLSLPGPVPASAAALAAGEGGGCLEDPLATLWALNGKRRDCRWLGRLPGRIERECSASGAIRDACPDTCAGRCGALAGAGFGAAAAMGGGGMAAAEAAAEAEAEAEGLDFDPGNTGSSEDRAGAGDRPVPPDHLLYRPVVTDLLSAAGTAHSIAGGGLLGRPRRRTWSEVGGAGSGLITLVSDPNQPAAPPPPGLGTTPLASAAAASPTSANPSSSPLPASPAPAFSASARLILPNVRPFNGLAPGALPYAVLERDPFYFTEMPSLAPSSTPTGLPTSFPSVAPSARPSVEWVPREAPARPRDSYFDYGPGRDGGESGRGPERWDDVDDPPEAEYWNKEYGEWVPSGARLGSNQCGNKSRKQSPIDVRFDRAHGQCFEYHNIRPKIGEYHIDHSLVDLQILPSKLRINYPTNFKSGWYCDGNDCVHGPSADIPKGWGHQLPVTHVDLKVPSEHWMEGKQYAAEYQVFLIQNKSTRRGSPAASVLFDIHPEEKPNARLGQLLRAFRLRFDADKAQCEEKRRKTRRAEAVLAGAGAGSGGGGGRALRGGSPSSASASGPTSSWLDEPEEEAERFRRNLRRARIRADRALAEVEGRIAGAQAVSDEDLLSGLRERPPAVNHLAGFGNLVNSTSAQTVDPLAGRKKFNVWDEEFFRTPWFFGYEGSLTEPPCSEFVDWRIMDTPALISSDQLREMKRLLFNHIDKDCKPTSVGYQQSVARPLQPYKDRMVHRCMCRDFIDDRVRDSYGNNRCEWDERDQFGFAKDVYTTEWYRDTHKYEDSRDQPSTTSF